MAKGTRVSQKLTPERLEVVEQMLRGCYTHGAIHSVLGRQWGITPNTSRKYIKRVYEKWEEEAKLTFVDRVQLRRSQLEGVLEQAMNQKPPDLRVAIAALDRLCRVDGAYAAEKSEVTVSGTLENRLRKMSSDDQRKELDSLFEKYTSVLPQAPRVKPTNGSNGHDAGGEHN